VPLQPIISGLPLELQPRVLQASVGSLAVSIPLEKILAQLSRGVVKVSFGELRQWAPEVFSPEEDRDRVLVSLPLGEILTRINPALIQRRRAQKHVEVPTEISSPFDAASQTLVFTVSPDKSEAPSPKHPHAAPAPARKVSPAPSGPEPVSPPIVFKRTNGSKSQSPGTAMPLNRGSLASAPTPPPPSGPELNIPITTPGRELKIKDQEPAPLRTEQAPVPAKNGHETLLVGLNALAEEWSEAIRREIVELKLVDAQVGLPMEALDQALKQGKIIFRWKTLRSWIKPTPLPSVSAHDNAGLELPLRLVAPLFLERQKQGQKTQHKVSIDEDIPNLFFGFPQPEVAGAANGATPGTSPGAKSGDTNYYVWDDGAEMVRVDESSLKKGPTAETRFAQKYATPNEVVSKAAALPGVVGVLIALPDGLLVANKLPADVNGDTLAAFLPQIFGKVSACTNELRTGELNNLNFTVGNVPWKIFRVNAIFFAAFGKAGQALPTAQLAALAANLDHKPK